MTNLDVMKKSITDCISKMDTKEFMELINLFEDNPDVIDIDTLDILTCEKCKKLYGDCAVDSEFTECESRFEKFTAEESM